MRDFVLFTLGASNSGRDKITIKSVKADSLWEAQESVMGIDDMVMVFTPKSAATIARKLTKVAQGIEYARANAGTTYKPVRRL